MWALTSSMALLHSRAARLESLENELSYDYNYELCSFSKLSVVSPTSQLILQPFPRFTYSTAHFPTLSLLHLLHSSFSNPSFGYPMSQDFHLRHLASRPCLHPTLSIASSFQFLIPNLFKSARTQFHHLVLGLPHNVAPSGVLLKTIFTFLVFSILMMCPNHLSL